MAKRARRRLFLSHSHKDRATVLQVASDLEGSRVQVWFDRWELRPGDSIIDKINDGIDSSAYLVVFLSTASLGSTWVRREMNAGLMAELSDRAVTVVVALLPGCDDSAIPTLLRDKVRLDFRISYLTGISDLLDIFKMGKKAADLLFRDATEFLQFDAIDKAIPLLKKALEKYPAHYDAMHNLGVSYQREKRYEEALPLFETLVRECSDNVLHLAGLGVTLLSLGKLEEGLSHLRQCAALAPEDLYIHFLLGTHLRRNGLHDEALPELEHVLRGNPEHIEARYEFAQALSGAGMLDDAVREFRRVLDVRPNFPDCLNNLGVALGESGDLAEACRQWEEATVLAPHLPDPHRNLARACWHLGRTSEALTHSRAIVAIEPDNTIEQYHYALILKQLGRKDEAIREFYRVLELQPGLKEARIALSELMGDIPAMWQAIREISHEEVSGKGDEWVKTAIHSLFTHASFRHPLQIGFTAEQYHEVKPNIDSIFNFLERAQGLLADDDSDEHAMAELSAELEKLASERPGLDAMRHTFLGIIALRNKEVQEAIGHFRHVVGLAPFAKEAHNNLGLAYAQGGQLGRAVEEWELALGLDPSDCTTRLHIAVLYGRLRLLPQAIQRYREFVENCPLHREAEGVRTLLSNLESVGSAD
ncbi:MAG: tetratricopeptide repeat protein [Chloroflexi bacterium]|nr:tetratricopeptide repeat protein [Chloroflexota bacterium]